MADSREVLVHSIVANRYPVRLRRFIKILEYNGVPCRLVDIDNNDFWDNLKNARAYVHNYVHRETEKQAAESILPVVEKVYGVPTFPNEATRWHYDDKIRQYYYLGQKGYPFIESWVFWDKESAEKWLENSRFPLVFKLKSGAGSNNVVLVNDFERAKRLVEKMFSSSGVDSEYVPNAGSLLWLRNLAGMYKLRQWIAYKLGRIHYQDIRPYWQRQRDYVFFQKFLPDNPFDVRITVIGGRAFAYRRWNRKGDFRASGSGNVDYDQSGIDKRCVSLAFKISRECGFQSMAYDFLFDSEGEPRIGEISYTYVDHLVYNCPGYYDENFNWHEGNHWPQLCILRDLLNEPSLEQPNFSDMENPG